MVTTSSGKLFQWLMTLCVKKVSSYLQSTLLFIEFQMVASGVDTGSDSTNQCHKNLSGFNVVFDGTENKFQVL